MDKIKKPIILNNCRLTILQGSVWLGFMLGSVLTSGTFPWCGWTQILPNFQKGVNVMAFQDVFFVFVFLMFILPSYSIKPCKTIMIKVICFKLCVIIFSLNFNKEPLMCLVCITQNYSLCQHAVPASTTWYHNHIAM